MKKLMAIAIIFVLCLMFAACGSSDDSSNAESGKIESSAIEESNTENGKNESSKTENGKNNAPEEINDDCSMDGLVAHIDAHKEVNDEYELSIHAEGNTLIYDYTFKSGVPDDTIQAYISMMKLDEAKANMESLKNQYNCVDSIKYIYKDSAGKILFEETY